MLYLICLHLVRKANKNLHPLHFSFLEKNKQIIVKVVKVCCITAPCCQIKGAMCSFGEEIQTQAETFNIYSID